MITTISPEQATRHVADHLADRDAFIVVPHPARMVDIAFLLRATPGTVAYGIHDTGTVTVTDDMNDLVSRICAVALSDIHTVALFAVPKTVPASELGTLLGHPIPEDGSQDVIICAASTGPMVFPLLFVEACRRVDPSAAAWIEANSLANLS